MKIGRSLRHLLPLMAIVGLLLGPLVAASERATAEVQSPTDLMSDMAADIMDDMPCCPSKVGTFSDCQDDCPLTSVCMVKCSAVVAVLGAASAFTSVDQAFLQQFSDLRTASSAGERPARPPRT